MNNKIRAHFLTFLGLLTTYCIAFGLDRWTEYLRQSFTISFGPAYQNWTWALANLILAFCVLALFIWAMPRLHPLAIVFVVILGLLVDFIPVFYWLPLGFPPTFLTQFMTGKSYTLAVGGWTAIAGIFTFIQTRAKREL